MNYVYISPHFPEIHAYYCIELRKAGLTVLGVGDAPYHELSWDLQDALTEYYKVDSLEDYDQVFRAIAFLSFKYGKIDWLESNNEHWLVLDAHLRTDFNITTGAQLDQIESIKSKAAMKKIYLEAGIPTARQCLLNDLEKATAFVKEVGFPVIAKPEIGVGATNSFKIESAAEWKTFLTFDLGVPYVLEEFIQGDIVSFDGIVGPEGELLFTTAIEWPPSILDIVIEEKDLCYRVIREIPVELQKIGERTVKAFSVKNRFIHLEFFRLTKAKKGLGKVGDYVALEVNMRPAGGNTPDMYNYANDDSVYRMYAEMVAFGKLVHRPKPTPFFCSYAGRRDKFRYSPSHETIMKTYGKNIVQQGRNPEMSVPQMGNQYYLLKSPSRAEVDAFEADVLRRVSLDMSAGR